MGRGAGVVQVADKLLPAGAAPSAPKRAVQIQPATPSVPRDPVLCRTRRTCVTTQLDTWSEGSRGAFPGDSELSRAAQPVL